MHLAELNIARLRQPLDHPASADFANALTRVNALAERMPGFVWRHIDESGNATDTRVDEDPNVIVNLSVWKDVASFETFVWGTVHKQFYDRRAEWFETLDAMHFAMWWVEKGHRPTIEEAAERLATLNRIGPSDYAFGWAQLTEATRWRQARCVAC